MSTIKNLHRLKKYDNEILSKIDQGALLHKRYSNIQFKIIGLYPKSIKIQTVQGKHLSENYADQKTLIERTKQLFEPLGLQVNVHAVIYKVHQLAQVDSAWIQNKMNQFHMQLNELVMDTDIDNTNLSAWINGKRPMSQPVKAMFWFYFSSRKKTVGMITTYRSNKFRGHKSRATAVRPRGSSKKYTVALKGD